MANATFWYDKQSASGTTAAGTTSTITVNQNCTGCWVAGHWLESDPFNVDGTLVFNMHEGSSVALGSWGSPDYDGAIIGSTGVVTVNGSNKQGNVDPTGTLSPVGFFNIAGHTVNNGVMNIGWTSLYNYNSTNTITGNGTINLLNVTLASDFRGNQDCYWNTTFTNISGQTINMTNSQISFGTRDGAGMASDVTINCIGGGNYIAFNAGMASNVTNVKIRGFGNGDVIDLGSYNMQDSYSYDSSTGFLTISTWYDNQYVSLSIDIGLGYDPLGFSAVKTYEGSVAGDTGISYVGAPPCYLSGTLIETARGSVAVENITLADRVVAYDNGKPVLRQVIWKGKSQIEACRSPVIVRQGALDENVPSRDLHVTQEHCLFLEGRFVPVRMLVNGHSVICDTRHENYDVYHIELDTHSVIKANGALSESFLDTGHLTFEGREMRNLSWERDSAAPLCIDRAFVEPLFRKIAERVPGLVIPASDTSPEHQAEIALLINGTTRIIPTRRNGKNVVFTIDEPIRSLHLLADVSSPSTEIGPYVDDRRELGALVGELHLFTPENMTSHREHLDTAALTGWHEKESADYRWTGAKAELPDIQSENSSAILSLELHA